MMFGSLFFVAFLVVVPRIQPSGFIVLLRNQHDSASSLSNFQDILPLHFTFIATLLFVMLMIQNHSVLKDVQQTQWEDQEDISVMKCIPK